jgi:hypothetical protein
MYNWAKMAFDSELEEQDKRIAFRKLYEKLKRDFKMVRGPIPAFPHWGADKTFDTLTNDCQAISRQSGLTLMALRPGTRESETVFEGLSKLRDLKETRYYPWMPVAKVTHFFNPLLFPIYDKKIIWEVVLNKVFRSDYRQWCKKIGVDPNETNQSANFNRTYTLMAASIMQEADGSFMDFFGQWFKRQVSLCNDEHEVLDEISRYYATAFEFVAIGAAHL